MLRAITDLAACLLSVSLVLASASCVTVTGGPANGNAAGNANDNAPNNTNDNNDAVDIENDNSGAGGAAEWQPLERLIATDPADNEVFGKAVAVSQDLLVVTAPGDDLARGAAYVFTRDGDDWEFEAKLSAADAREGYDFGTAVAIAGEEILVGASGTGDTSGFVFEAGAVYVYGRDGAAWTQHQRLEAFDAENLDNFGFALDADGDVLVVGAQGRNDLQGIAYVYRRTGGSWVYEAQLAHDDGINFDRFGATVAVSGDVVAVGAPVQEFGTGAVYLFERDGAGAWSQTQKLLAPVQVQTEQFGHDVTLEGDTLVVGAPLTDDNTGAVYVYERTGGAWTLSSTLRNEDDDAFGHQFGWAVSISGDRLAIGSPVVSTIFLYHRSGATWNREAALISDESLVATDLFGETAYLSGDLLVGGAPFDPNQGYATGAAYVFERR